MQKRNLLGLTLIGLFLAIGLIVPAAATQHYWVDDDGSNATGDGSESDPWRTITRVLTDGTIEGSSSDPVIIHVKAGTYSPSMHSTEYETFPLQMKSYFSIQGEGGRDNTIIDAEQTERVMGCFYANHISVSGVTITRGDASSAGGGFTIHAADSVAVDDCVITDNEGAYGGGGYVVTGSNDVSFTNCILSHNTSTSNGGGIYCLVLVEIADCVFEDNEASNTGGGVYTSSNTTVDRCDFKDNRAGTGGGIYANGSPYIRYCTFNGNDASADDEEKGGGGVCGRGNYSWPVIRNCEFYNNSAVRGGAVMFVNQVEPTIHHCEIYNNTASKSGGGIHCSIDIGDASITYCEIHDNEATSENGGGILIQERVTLSLGSCVIEENLAPSGNGGGVYCYDHVNLELNSNIIYHNTAGGGGGVYAERECDVDFKGFDRITYNIATFGAGIYFSGDSSNPVGGSIFNTVIAHNDSNGIRFMNTYNSVEILNCTIYSNANVGVLAVGEAPVTLTNCIIWNNGDDISGVSCDDISHCDIEDKDCEGQNGNFSEDPLFVGFSDAPYYLCHKDVGGMPIDSPCIDAGDDESSQYGLDQYTTCSNGRYDRGTVDVGFHYERRYRGTLYYVDGENGDDSNDGSEDHPWKTITHALKDEVDGGPLNPATIIVKSATYSSSADPYEEFPIVMEPYVALEGQSKSNTFIDAESSDRVILFDNVNNIYLSGFTIQGGNTDNEGGGVRVDNTGSDTVLRSIIAKNNTATKGGGIYCIASSPILENCELSANTAERGAGIAFDAGGEPILETVTVSSNTASLSGGGIYVSGNGGVSFTDCTVSGNEAASGGGVYICNDCSPAFSGGSVSSSTASSEGGGIWVGDTCGPSFTDCAIANHNTAVSGGGVYAGGNCTPSFTDCPIDHNDGSYGGGIHTSEDCAPTFTNCPIESNTATSDGGGIFADGNSSPIITECSISSNAASSGGGVHTEDYCTPSLTDCTLASNSSDTDGAGVSCAGTSQPEFDNCEITGNSAGTDGGGVSCDGDSSPLFTNCKLNDNSASQDGGAIASVGQSSPTFDGKVIVGNEASRDGGGILFGESSTPRLEGCVKVSNNRAGEAGGGIFCTGSCLPYIVNALITENEVTGGSGLGCGIFWESSSSGQIINCTIEGNLDSGVYASGGSPPELINCIIWNNGDDIDGISCDLISHCDIEDGDCEGQDGNISDDPLFVPIYRIPYYLSHEEAQEQASPCLDAGTGDVSDYGLEDTTTCTDGRADGDDDGDGNTGPIDIGYHYDHGLETLYVNADTGDDGNTGGWHDPFKTIAHAVTQANGTEENPCLITVAAGTYDHTNNGETFPYQINAYTILLGAGSAEGQTTVDAEGGDYGDRVFVFSGAGSGYGSMAGFRITRSYRAAIKCDETSSIAILNCVLISNEAYGDGALFVQNSDDILVRNCTIQDNKNRSTNLGAGMYVGSCSPTIENCTIHHNEAWGDGGGIYFSDTSATFSDCTITNNKSRSQGGAIYSMKGTVSSPFKMTNCTITGNTTTGTYGGTIYLDGDGRPRFTGCTVSDNQASTDNGRGGAFNVHSAIPYITDCTMDGNTADECGGAILFWNRGAAIMKNCLITNNEAGEGSGITHYTRYNVTSLNCCTLEGNSGEGVRVTDAAKTMLTLTNCILWNNGDDIVGLPCSQISHCDIEDDDCNYDEDINLNQDPIFMPRDPEDEDVYTGYYLAQEDAQAGDSPCLNEGDDQASAYGLDIYTTCTDGSFDQGLVDIGYHYREAYEGEDDTYIELVSFEAKARERDILISWKTGTEIRNAGFNLYRVEAGDRMTPVKINDRLIPTKGSPAAGASYEFVDSDVRPGGAYSYYLVDIETDGTGTRHGPVSARALLMLRAPKSPVIERPARNRALRYGLVLPGDKADM